MNLDVLPIDIKECMSSNPRMCAICNALERVGMDNVRANYDSISFTNPKRNKGYATYYVSEKLKNWQYHLAHRKRAVPITIRFNKGRNGNTANITNRRSTAFSSKDSELDALVQ